jgi:hypothetical protein
VEQGRRRGSTSVSREAELPFPLLWWTGPPRSGADRNRPFFQRGHSQRLTGGTRGVESVAIRMFFDYLVVGQIIPMNPASSVRGQRHIVKRGKAVVLSAEDTCKPLNNIDTLILIGLRARVLIATMDFSFARQRQNHTQRSGVDSDYICPQGLWP